MLCVSDTDAFYRVQDIILRSIDMCPVNLYTSNENINEFMGTLVNVHLHSNLPYITHQFCIHIK